MTLEGSKLIDVRASSGDRSADHGFAGCFKRKRRFAPTFSRGDAISEVHDLFEGDRPIVPAGRYVAGDAAQRDVLTRKRTPECHEANPRHPGSLFEIRSDGAGNQIIRGRRGSPHVSKLAPVCGHEKTAA